MAEQTVIIDVTLNAADATQKANDLGQSIKRIREEQKYLKDQGKENDIAFQSNAATLRQVVAEQKAYVQIANAAEGSNNQLRAQLSLLTQQYNALGSAERDGTTAGKALQVQIKGISDELKKNESAVGDNRRNVGNYKDALTQSNDATASAVATQRELTNALAPNTIGFRIGGEAINNVTSQLQAFRQATQEAKVAQTAYKEAQQVSTKATQEAEIATRNAEAIGFKFTQGKVTQSAVVAANTAAQNANIVATEAQAAATAASVTATNASTNAMKIFKVALASTGIGAIVIIVAALVSYLSKFDPIIDKVEQAFAAVGAVINRVTGIVVDFFTSLTSVGDFFSRIGSILSDPIGSFKELASEINNAATAAANLKKAQQDLEDQVKIQEISNARAIQQVKQLTLQARNRSLSEKERQDLLKQAATLDENNFKQQQKIANEKKRIAVEDIKIQGNLTQAQVDRLNKEGIAYAFALKDQKNITDEQVDALKEAELEKIKNLEETTNRQEKNQNLQDALAEKAQAAAEKRAARAEQLRQKAEEADKERLDSLVRTNEAIQTERKNEEDAVNREIDEKVKKYRAYGKTTEQLELERTSRLKEIQKQYNEEIKKSTDEVLLAVEEIYISRIKSQQDREIAQIAFNNQRKLEQLDESIIATEERIRLGETGLTDLLKAQNLLRSETLAQSQIEIDAKNKAYADQKAEEVIAREQSIFDAKLKIQDEERKLQDDGLKLLETVFGKETALGKAAFLAQKAFAVARIIIDTQAALAANRLAEQVLNAQLSAVPFAGPFLVAANSIKQQAERTRITISGAISAGVVLASAVAGFKEGVIGFQSDGLGSMVKGKGSATSDSINARLSNGESVINARSTALYAPLLSAINEAGGGRPLQPGFAMATGGIAQGGFVSSISSDVTNQNDSVNLILSAIRAMPNPVVSVEQFLSVEQQMNAAIVQTNL